MAVDVSLRATRLLLIFATVAPPAFALIPLDYYLRALAAAAAGLGAGLMVAWAWPTRWDDGLSWAPLGGWTLGLGLWVGHLL